MVRSCTGNGKHKARSGFMYHKGAHGRKRKGDAKGGSRRKSKKLR